MRVRVNAGMKARMKAPRNVLRRTARPTRTAHTARTARTTLVTLATLAAAVAPVVLVALATLLTTAAPSAQASPGDVIDDLVAGVMRQFDARIRKPIGKVVERRRSKVYVAIRTEPPPAGTRFLVLRPLAGFEPARERLIASLVVQKSTAGLLECREVDRTTKEHAEPGDLVRQQQVPLRVLLAPTIAVVDVAPVIPEVTTSKLRAALRQRGGIDLVEDDAAARRAEAAYWSGETATFLAAQDDLDQVIFPVLMRTPEKLMLSFESFDVATRRAMDVDVAAVPLDATMRSWLRAGMLRTGAPPGFRLLGSQLFAWDVLALWPQDSGVVVVARDSLHVLAFRFPGLRPRSSTWLGARSTTRRHPTAFVFPLELLHPIWPPSPEGATPAGGATSRSSSPPAPGTAALLFSDERAPVQLERTSAERTGATRVDDPGLPAALEAWWTAAGGPRSLAARWAPVPGGRRVVVHPLQADADGDTLPDLLWSDVDGDLVVQTARASRPLRSRAYGDAKCVQPAQGPESRPVLWLTDPVWEEGGDRLHAVRIENGRFTTLWTSEPFDGRLVALCSVDLNGDSAAELLAAEAVPGGTRLHVFLALPGEHTPARGATTTAASRSSGR